MDEVVLVKKYNDGDSDAFRYIYEKYYPILVNFGVQFIGNAETVKDICQNLFVTIWEKKYQFRNLSALKTFLYTSIRNRCLDYLKSQKVKKTTGISDYEQIKSDSYFQEKVIQEEVFLHLEQLIKELPQGTRNVIELGLKGHKNEEIAHILDISINTVKTHRRRGLVFLRKNMSGNNASIFMLIFSVMNILNQG